MPAAPATAAAAPAARRGGRADERSAVKATAPAGGEFSETASATARSMAAPDRLALPGPGSLRATVLAPPGRAIGRADWPRPAADRVRGVSATAAATASCTARCDGPPTATGLRDGRASANWIRAPRSAALRPPAPAWAVLRSRSSLVRDARSAWVRRVGWSSSARLPSSRLLCRSGRAGGRPDVPTDGAAREGATAGAAAGAVAAGDAAGLLAGVTEAGRSGGREADSRDVCGRAAAGRAASAWARAAKGCGFAGTVGRASVRAGGVARTGATRGGRAELASRCCAGAAAGAGAAGATAAGGCAGVCVCAGACVGVCAWASTTGAAIVAALMGVCETAPVGAAMASVRACARASSPSATGAAGCC